MLRWVSVGVCWLLAIILLSLHFCQSHYGTQTEFLSRISFSSSLMEGEWAELTWREGGNKSSAWREGANKKWLHGPVKALEIAQVRRHVRALSWLILQNSTRDGGESELHRLWGLVWASWGNGENEGVGYFRGEVTQIWPWNLLI